jgi:hypothetical protein
MAQSAIALSSNHSTVSPKKKKKNIYIYIYIYTYKYMPLVQSSASRQQCHIAKSMQEQKEHYG